MDCVGPILDIGIRLWDCSAKRLFYVQNLEKNVEKLSCAMEELKGLSEDVKRRVEFSERRDLQCTEQVKGWLKSVDNLESAVSRIVEKGNEEIQGKCLGCRPKSCWSSYKIGKTVVKKLVLVEKIVKKGRFERVADRKPIGPVNDLPEERTVGLDSTLSEVWKCVRINDVGIIGLYGMGGVGKTTLLKRINNTFFSATSNDDSDDCGVVVIWVVVSKEASTAKIQSAIRNRLQIPDDVWNAKNAEDRAMEIYKALRGKKFVLLLDDLWKRFDLLKAGIPLPDIHNGSKVIFTTRSKEVCGQMEADRCVRVECLGRDEALDLFLAKVGKEALNSHPNVSHLAKVVAEECKGLPLALITIGRSMASRKTIEEWERAVEVLRSYPASFAGIVDYVYHLLKFSFDSLPSPTLKSCFLYCSLFPKGYSIRKSKLIDLWIGEGFLDDELDGGARRQGEEIVGSLKLACLMEAGESDEFVKMHDVTRDMAFWLACDHGDSKNKFLVKESLRHKYFPKDSERVSLWGQEIRDLEGVTLNPSIVTLLVTGTLISKFPSELCKSTDALAVLDLSGNERLTLLPEGIGSLRNLRYFNLSRTAISALPVETKNLWKLRSLLLDDTYNLVNVPSEVVSGLSSLQAFSRLLSPARMQFHPEYDETALLDALESLECVDDVCLTISYPDSIQKVISSSKFQGCVMKLSVLCSVTSFDMSTTSLGRMRRLEALEVWNADPLRIYVDEEEEEEEEEVEDSSLQSLRSVAAVQCEMWDMDWLACVPNLRTLRIEDCCSIREVLRGEGRTLASVETLRLQGLPRLERIRRRAGVGGLPVVKEVEVMRCPGLRRAPFGWEESVKEMRGQREWWDSLVWDDDKAEALVAHKFVVVEDPTSCSCAGIQESAPILSLLPSKMYH